MELIAQFFTQPWMWVVFVLMISLVFLWCLIFYSPKLCKIRKELSKAVSCFPQSVVENSSDEKYRNDQKLVFYENFEKIFHEISNIELLSHSWHEFMESICYRVDDGADKVVYLSHRPAQYFNQDSILGERMNVSQYLAYPNYLIGIGLFFTFLGIAAALQVAQAGLAGSDGGQKAMQELLAVASTKFISSLVGIILSLILSFFQKWHLKLVQIKINDVCQIIEVCTEFKSAEKLIFDSNDELRRHTLALNDMASKISDGISQVLGNQLPTSVANALKPLAEEIQNLAQKFSGSNEGALNSVLQEFLSQLRKSSGEDMQALIDSVKILKTVLDKLVVNMQSTSESFGAETKESTSRLSQTLENFTNSFVPIQQGIDQFSSVLGSLDNIANKIENAGSNINGAAEISNKSMFEFSGSVGEFSGQIEHITQALHQIENTAKQLQVAGEKIFSASDGMKHSASSMESAGNRFHEKVEIFEKVSDGIYGTVNTLSKASENIVTATEPLSEMSNGMNKVILQLHETEKRIQDTQKEVNAMFEGLNKYSETIPDLWEQYSGRFSQVDKDLEKAFSQLTDGSEHFRNGIESFVKEIDGNFSTAINQLSGAISELQEEREQGKSDKDV